LPWLYATSVCEAAQPVGGTFQEWQKTIHVLPAFVDRRAESAYHWGMPTLFLSSWFRADSQALWREAIQRGWTVHRLAGWRVPGNLLNIDEPAIYSEAVVGPGDRLIRKGTVACA
jgi:hypothetical protein